MISSWRLQQCRNIGNSKQIINMVNIPFWNPKYRVYLVRFQMLQLLLCTLLFLTIYWRFVNCCTIIFLPLMSHCWAKASPISFHVPFSSATSDQPSQCASRSKKMIMNDKISSYFVFFFLRQSSICPVVNYRFLQVFRSWVQCFPFHKLFFYINYFFGRKKKSRKVLVWKPACDPNLNFMWWIMSACQYISDNRQEIRSRKDRFCKNFFEIRAFDHLHTQAGPTKQCFNYFLLLTITLYCLY